MKKSFIGLLAALFVVLGTFGCSSKTLMTVMGAQFGGSVEVHEPREPSVSSEPDEFCLDLFVVGFCLELRPNQGTFFELTHNTLAN